MTLSTKGKITCVYYQCTIVWLHMGKVKKNHKVGIKEVRLACGHHNGSWYCPDYMDRGWKIGVNERRA